MSRRIQRDIRYIYHSFTNYSIYPATCLRFAQVWQKMSKHITDWQIPVGISRGLWNYVNDSSLAQNYDQSLAVLL